MIGEQQLDRVAETDALALHHPADHVSALLAGAQAVPEILLRCDDERGFMIVMEGTQAQQVLAVPLERDASRLHQPLQGNFLLDSLDHRVRDARHENRPPSENCQLTIMS